MVVECNKKPLFTEEPKESEIRRIIDIPFRSKFTENIDDLDTGQFIFKANIIYKTAEFQEKHKYALIQILIEEHKKFINNGSVFILPKTIVDRTNLYLELSCNILQWFKTNFQETKDKNILKIKDIYETFCLSDYYNNLSKFERRKYNKNYFIEYFETNIFLRKFYKNRFDNIRNIILYWKPIDDED